MDFDWQKPLRFDWAGRIGPPLTEEDINNSVINRILKNQFYAPSSQREIVRKKPWWDPRNPFGTYVKYKTTKYIPGKQRTPQYPELSTLSKQQHLQGLRVLSTEYEVQPWDYPSPTAKDFEAFENFKELYEKEQKDYQIWAKMCWINGDCIRALHPKPLLETVYDAQFRLKTNEIHTLPTNFSMAAQISLEARMDAFELQLIKDLISVDVKSLPIVEYPDELEQDLSILQPCSVPEPCQQHASRFILPHEKSISVLPLFEVHRELANYAIQNEAAFIASENALQCFLDMERSWKLPISVVEVICPEGGGAKTVVVLGSEFSIQKECVTQRTVKAYRHLLRNTFTKSTESSTTKLAQQPSTTKQPDRFHSKEDDNTCSSDDEPLKMDVEEQRPNVTRNVTARSSSTEDAEIPSCGSRINQLTVNDHPSISNTEQLSLTVSKNKQENHYNHVINKQGANVKKSQSNKISTAKFDKPIQSRVNKDNDLNLLNKTNPNMISSSNGQTYISNDEQLKIDVVEQRRRSTDSPNGTLNVIASSISTKDAEIPKQPFTVNVENLNFGHFVARQRTASQTCNKNNISQASKCSVPYKNTLRSSPRKPKASDTTASTINESITGQSKESAMLRPSQVCFKSSLATAKDTNAQNVDSSNNQTKVDLQRKRKFCEEVQPNYLTNKECETSNESDGTHVTRLSANMQLQFTNPEKRTTNALNEYPINNDIATNHKSHLYTSKSVKTNKTMISITDLFGDESDDDEPKREENSTCETRKNTDAIVEIDNNLSDSAVDETDVLKKNGSIAFVKFHNTNLKPCLKNPESTYTRPTNIERKLSFSDPLTSDPEFYNTDPATDSMAISSKTTMKPTYVLHPCKINHKPAATTKHSGFTKITPELKQKKSNDKVLRRSPRIALQSSESDSDYTVLSKHNCEPKKPKNKVTVRRNRSISAETSESDSENFLSSNIVSTTSRKRTENISPRRSNRLSQSNNKANCESKQKNSVDNISVKLRNRISPRSSESESENTQGHVNVRRNRSFSARTSESDSYNFQSSGIVSTTSQKNTENISPRRSSRFSSSNNKAHCENKQQRNSVDNIKVKLRNRISPRNSEIESENTQGPSTVSITNKRKNSRDLNIILRRSSRISRGNIIDSNSTCKNNKNTSADQSNSEMVVQNKNTLRHSKSPSNLEPIKPQTKANKQQTKRHTDEKLVEETSGNNSERKTANTNKINKIQKALNADYFDYNNEIQEVKIFHITATNDSDEESILEENLQTEPEIQQTPNFSFNTNNAINVTVPQAISETSHDSDDYFENDESQEFKIFHFTATNDSDSDEEPALKITVTNDSDEESILEENYQTEPEIQRPPNFSFNTNNAMNVTVPQESETETKIYRSTNFSFYTNYETVEQELQPEVHKQINVAGMYTEINEAKANDANDDISLDTTTLSTEAINDIIGVNPSSPEDINDIICDISCTCKGTIFEVPSPRSFKKWQVKKAASNQSFNLIVHSSHKVRRGNKEVILEPIVEWQPELGACKQPEARLRALALSLMIRPKAELINVRVDYSNGNVIVIDKMDETVFMKWHGDRRSEIADKIHMAVDQLRFLKPGQYILAHDSCHGANAMLYSTQAVAGFSGSADHTLSLRPENENMPDAEDASFVKIPPELSPALLPYHKHQGILPLAFTTDESQVKENKKVTAALARARQPPLAIQWMKKKRKKKKKKKQRPPNEI